MLTSFAATHRRSSSSGACRRFRHGRPLGNSKVFRFSCLKFLGVSGVFDYAGLS
jgi:hypothetical protein